MEAFSTRISTGGPGSDGGRERQAGIVDGEILPERFRLSARVADFRHYGGGIASLLGGAGVMDGHPGTGSGQDQSDGAADFAAGAGHQSGTAVEAERDEGVGHDACPCRSSHASSGAWMEGKLL